MRTSICHSGYLWVTADILFKCQWTLDIYIVSLFLYSWGTRRSSIYLRYFHTRPSSIQYLNALDAQTNCLIDTYSNTRLVYILYILSIYLAARGSVRRG